MLKLAKRSILTVLVSMIIVSAAHGRCPIALCLRPRFSAALSVADLGGLQAQADVSASKTTLTFSASIASTLRDGDTISLSLDQIRVGGRAKAAWSRADAYNANRLAGLRDFANDAATQPRLLGHKVSLVAGVNDQATIPVGWSTDPVFSFASLQGTWKRHSAATSPIDMQAPSRRRNLCPPRFSVGACRSR